MGCRVKPGKEMMMSYLICALTAAWVLGLDPRTHAADVATLRKS